MTKLTLKDERRAANSQNLNKKQLVKTIVVSIEEWRDRRIFNIMYMYSLSVYLHQLQSRTKTGM